MFNGLRPITMITYRYSNEAERADYDIYDDFKLKTTFGYHGLYKNCQHFNMFKV